MNRFITIFGIVALMCFASATAGEVELKKAPLEWQQAATIDGGVLYRNLCASCHGLAGKGDGPAASALKKTVPDLTVLAVNNDGVYPHEQVEKAITGKSRVVAHGTIDMPVWGQQFVNVRPDWKQFRRNAFAHQRIYNLTLHIETLQSE